MALRSVNQLDSATDLSIPVDVRGWEVRTTVDDEKVGKVHDVLVDEGGSARYLDIDLGIFQKHVLLPVGQAATDEQRDVVWVGGMDKDSFKNVPKYEHGEDVVDAEFESRLGSRYDESYRAPRYHRPEYGGAGAPLWARTSASSARVMGTEEIRLRRLSELDDYEVADHDPDPRGWELVGAAGEEIGRIEDLVVDPQAMKARYFEVELKGDVIGDADHALIPVGYARLDATHNRVRVDTLDRGAVGTLPRYRESFDDEYEDRIERHFSSRFEGSSRYRHPRYDSVRLYSARTRTTDRTPSTDDRLGDVHLRR
jgi:photosynthetic reaction center H subunit